MTPYTAVFGQYDELRHAPPGAVLFTDHQPPSHLGWDARVTEPPYPNAARSNRYFKLQPHAHLKAERTLYFDTRVRFRASPTELLALFQEQAGGDHDVFLLTHTLGHDLAREIEWVREKRITSDAVLDAQRARYQDLGVPLDLPTCQAAIIIARINAATRAFFDTWWGEVRDYSHRDQISFPYARRVSTASVHLTPYAFAREHFRLGPHAQPQLQEAI